MVLKLIEIPIYRRTLNLKSELEQQKQQKTAIKFIINLKSDARKVIKKVGGNKTANLFDKAYSPIVKELKSLLKWSEVPAQAVGDAAYLGALNAGLSKGNAGIISTTIKEAISWLF